MIDPSGGPEYQEPTWQEARDFLAADIEAKAGTGTLSLKSADGDGMSSARRILAMQADHFLLVDVGQGPDGQRLGVVVDRTARALQSGGTLHDLLAEGWWDPADGSPADYEVAGWLLDTLPADLTGWAKWLDGALARPKDPAECPVPLPPPSTHRPPRWG